MEIFQIYISSFFFFHRHVICWLQAGNNNMWDAFKNVWHVKKKNLLHMHYELQFA